MTFWPYAGYYRFNNSHLTPMTDQQSLYVKYSLSSKPSWKATNFHHTYGGQSQMFPPLAEPPIVMVEKIGENSISWYMPAYTKIPQKNTAEIT